MLPEGLMTQQALFGKPRDLHSCRLMDSFLSKLNSKATGPVDFQIRIQVEGGAFSNRATADSQDHVSPVRDRSFLEADRVGLR